MGLTGDAAIVGTADWKPERKPACTPSGTSVPRKTPSKIGEP